MRNKLKRFDYSSSTSWMMLSKREVIIFGVVSLLSFVLGILVYYLSNISAGTTSEFDSISNGLTQNEESIQMKLIEGIQTNRIKEYFKYLTKEPHIAGGKRDDELARFIQKQFLESGLDSADLLPYDFLLSYPNSSNPNKIYIHDGNELIFESKHMEDPIHSNDAHPNFIHAFNAYSIAGTVKTNPGTGVIYVNFGRIEDFKMVENMGINITGHIVMARYGKIFRGNKVRHAEIHGAKGIILFSDPEDVAAEGTEPSHVYDKSFWVPGSGIERGSIYLEGDGDPLTPGWPSTKHAYRLPVDEVRLSKIPCQPIGYTDAKKILELLDGNEAPQDWQGGIQGLTYRIGPNFKPSNAGASLTLSTHNYEKVTKNYNVIGTIKGAIEPDRYVLTGNHRDAWGYGAVDPSSGTAQLLESVANFGELLKSGWRPRRTLVFCSWAAEEYALIGSVEWVEQHMPKLQSRAVAYINNDVCSGGSIFNINSSPLLRHLAVNITKLIPGVQDATKRLFDEWLEYQKDTINDESIPRVDLFGSGSDHAPFAFDAGVPIVDFYFGPDERKYNMHFYPSFHTGYETFYMVDNFMDQGYKLMQTCARVSTLLAHGLATSGTLPFSPEEYSLQMNQSLHNFKKGAVLKKIVSDQYDELQQSIIRFQTASKDFEEKDMIASENAQSLLNQRMVNDQLMQIERSFIMSAGLPGRPSNIRHAIFAPSQFDDYANAGFPGLIDLLYDYEQITEEEEKRSRENTIKRHLSDLIIMTDQATSLFKEFHLL